LTIKPNPFGKNAVTSMYRARMVQTGDKGDEWVKESYIAGSNGGGTNDDETYFNFIFTDTNLATSTLSSSLSLLT
jgi:hypothetical protein